MNRIFLFDPCKLLDREEWTRLDLMSEYAIEEAIRNKIQTVYPDSFVWVSVFAISGGGYIFPKLANEEIGILTIDSGLVCLLQITSKVNNVEELPNIPKSQLLGLDVTSRPLNFVLDASKHLKSFSILNNNEKTEVFEFE